MKGRTFAVLLGVVIAAAAAGRAPPVKPNDEAARSALQGFLRGLSDAGVDSSIAEARKQLEIGALRAPGEMRIANVLLLRGFTGAGVQALLKPRGIELVSIEAKVPLREPGQMMTIWIGQQSMPPFADSLEEQVDKAIGRERFEFLLRAQRLGNDPLVQTQAAEIREVAMSPEFAVYRLEIAGSREALFSLLRDPAVRAVFVDEDERRVAAFREQQRLKGAMVIKRGPTVSMGRIDPDEPLPRLPDTLDGPNRGEN